MQRRDRGIVQSLGGPLLKKVKESRVLIVGAGGIGCELLKNLVCSGFGSYPTQQASSNGVEVEENAAKRKPEIVVVDLDTIDLSNLNRQFLFRKHHIKKPKAIVAKQTASQFNPSVNIDAHHANIFDKKYDVEFFKGFNVVFNALDNLAARRRVNKMCLAANVPLIESGTTGFSGQVQTIQKGMTECYDCNPKPVQKSFPICTIRSTPSQPIHCIVWAKSYLFPELFGTSDESSDMTVTEDDSVEEMTKLKEEAEALKRLRSLMGTSELAKEIFNKVFHDDIERLQSMEEMWQTRKAPESVKFEAQMEDSKLIEQGKALAAQDQKTWSILENISVFSYSVDALSKRAQAGESVIEFDKDDKDTLDFVASAANVRSHIFGIPLHSEWEIKQMAGNIIPAIATSNALIGSLCVLEAFKILRSQGSKAIASQHPTTTRLHSANGKDEPVFGGSKTVFLTSKSTEKLITSQSLAPPRPDCAVCSPVYAELLLPQASSQTLQHLVDVLKKTIGYEDFSIAADVGLVYDADLDDNLNKSLAELGIDGQNNGFVTVLDDSDEPKVDLILSTKSQPKSSDDAEGFGLQLVPETIKLPLKTKPEKMNGEAHDVGDGSPEPVLNPGLKRKREAEEEIEDAKKKVKASMNESLYIVEDDGAILLD